MRIFLSIYFLLLLFISNSQLTVNNTPTAIQLVQNVLVGSGISVSNITYSGDNLQKGSFNGSASNIGINSGIMLSSGDVNDAIGPNNSGSTTSTFGGFFPLPSTDADIEQLIGFNSPYDLVKLEFDFIPTGDSVSFNYVFASEEYLEFVNAGVNDAFGFFLSGPGIAGPFTNGAKNIALIPGTTTYISIDNVNSTTNPSYYVNNGTGTSSPQNTSNTVVQCDGFTVKLKASALVQCGQTYHIKIALADVGDAAYDSWVFIEGGTFNSTGTPATLIEANNSTVNDTSICAGQGIDVEAIPGTPNYISMNWNYPLPNTPGPHTVYPNDTTTYEVYTTYAVCGDTIIDTASITINVSQIAPPDFTADTLFGCSGTVVQFSGTASEPISNWKWYFGDGDSATSQNPSHTYTSEGLYDIELEITNASGCKGFLTKSNYINIHPNPNVSFLGSDTLFCDIPASVNFNNNSSISSGAIDNWAWSFGDGSTSTSFQPNHIYNTYGAFDVALIATSDIGCSDTLSKTHIYIDPKPIVDFYASDTSGCEVLKVNFEDNSTVINPGIITSWNWDFGNGNTSANQNPTGINYSMGTYDVTLTVSTVFGCKDTLTFSNYIESYSNPVALFNLSDSLFCGTPSIINFTDGSSDISGIITDWEWDFGNGNTSSSQNTSETYTNDGVFDIKLIVTNSNTCKDTITKSITVAPKPIADFSVDTTESCAPHTFSFTNNSTVNTGNITSWNWNFGNGNTSSSQNPTNNYTIEGLFDVNLVITTEFGCKDTMLKSDLITTHPSPLALFIYSQDANAFFDQSIQFTNLSENHSESNWSFGDGETSQEESPFHAFELSKEYTVILNVSNQFLCNAQMEKTVLVRGINLLYVPNAFTPGNYDNVNNLFLAYGNYIKTFEMKIFDRWGTILFETNDIEKGWDGTVDNVLLPNDTYIWRVIYTDFDNKKYNESGHVTLIR